MDASLARITPPAEPLGTAVALRTLVRNPIEAWPRAVYEEPLFRGRLLGRPTVFVSDPDLIREVLVDQADAFVKAESMRRALAPALGDAILTADGPRWRWQRRAAAPIFRHERLQGFAPAMIAAAGRARDRLLARPGATVDVAHEMMRTTFDIIVETMLSGRGGIDVDRVERGVTEYLEATGWAIAYALLKVPDWMPYPGRRRAERARGYLKAELLRLAAEGRGAGTRRNDLLTLLLDATDPETGQAMDDRDVADNLMTFMTAGHETTALALTWTFYLLDRHPAMAEAVRGEIDRVTGGGPLDESHLPGLVLTRQVIEEALRLYPPAPIVVRSPVRDVVVGGETIPAGTPTYVPIYAVHRHRRLWDDPDAFDPRRFAPEAARGRHRYAYLPFGAGPRICIGMGFALMEAVLILAVLLREVRLVLAPGHRPALKMRVTLRPAGGMPMTALPR